MPLSFSFPTPELEGRSNLTSLDIQIKKLRDNALTTIMNGARRMREEASEIRDTLTDIESWADKLKMLAEEVQTQRMLSLWSVRVFILINRKWLVCPVHSLSLCLPSFMCFYCHCASPRTACLTWSSGCCGGRRGWPTAASLLTKSCTPPTVSRPVDKTVARPRLSF